MGKKAILELTDKKILVLGGEGLIGKAICAGLSQLGALVIDADLSLSGFEESKCQASNQAKCHVDITSDSSLKAMFEQIGERFGPINVLVNAAYPRGKHYGQSLWEARGVDLCENMALHAGGFFRASRAAARRMIDAKIPGSIIHFGSIHGVMSPDFSLYEGTTMTSPPDYAFIKGGIVQFTRYLAVCLGPEGIRVNCVSPGGVLNQQNEKFVQRYIERTPLRRMATPEDLVGPVAFLASDASTYITGQNLLVDGGRSLV